MCIRDRFQPEPCGFSAVLMRLCIIDDDGYLHGLWIRGSARIVWFSCVRWWGRVTRRFVSGSCAIGIGWRHGGWSVCGVRGAGAEHRRQEDEQARQCSSHLRSGMYTNCSSARAAGRFGSPERSGTLRQSGLASMLVRRPRSGERGSRSGFFICLWAVSLFLESLRRHGVPTVAAIHECDVPPLVR